LQLNVVNQMRPPLCHDPEPDANTIMLGLASGGAFLGFLQNGTTPSGPPQQPGAPPTPPPFKPSASHNSLMADTNAYVNYNTISTAVAWTCSDGSTTTTGCPSSTDSTSLSTTSYTCTDGSISVTGDVSGCSQSGSSANTPTAAPTTAPKTSAARATALGALVSLIVPAIVAMMA